MLFYECVTLIITRASGVYDQNIKKNPTSHQQAGQQANSQQLKICATFSLDRERNPWANSGIDLLIPGCALSKWDYSAALLQWTCSFLQLLWQSGHEYLTSYMAVLYFTVIFIYIISALFWTGMIQLDLVYLQSPAHELNHPWSLSIQSLFLKQQDICRVFLKECNMPSKWWPKARLLIVLKVP